MTNLREIELGFSLGLEDSLFQRLYRGLDVSTDLYKKGYEHGYACGKEMLAEKKRTLEMSTLRANQPHV